MQQKAIQIIGARENNLKGLSVEVPKHMVTVFTGVSGSGKSSLVFDTIAAESQRQLNETFTAFVRNRLPKYGQPDVDDIANLSTAVIIDQKRIGGERAVHRRDDHRHLRVAPAALFPGGQALDRLFERLLVQ